MQRAQLPSAGGILATTDTVSVEDLDQPRLRQTSEWQMANIEGRSTVVIMATKDSMSVRIDNWVDRLFVMATNRALRRVEGGKRRRS